ncbi:MAG: serine hydrolase [Gammaproteobacteria bacterium]|nr:serine hydrolase [Gammaproteobacteria bacterium]
MYSRVIQITTILLSTCTIAVTFAAADTGMQKESPMQGVPPTRASQVTLQNYREYPMSRWAFRNAGGPLHVVMVPRGGRIFPLRLNEKSSIGYTQHVDLFDQKRSFEKIFEDNYADGIVVVHGETVLYEKYFGDFNADAQHIWFSMTKSLVSAAFGLLVEQNKVDLQASPAKYLPELAGSGFERVTIQHILDHATAISFKENYTDPKSDFAVHYAPALSMGWLPGAADANPASTEIYGVHDFLVHFIKPDPQLKPGDAFDYNSSNADLLGWLIARISGQSLQHFIRTNIWAKLGTEHDAYMAVDRAYMPVATGGMNSTLRDAARFGMMLRDGGVFNGQRVVPDSWVNAILDVTDQALGNMSKNPKYGNDPWRAYHNMWWILNEKSGEFCAVGIHGQVIYINRSADTVVVWFSSQPGASAASNPVFHSKLKVARELAASLAD